MVAAAVQPQRPGRPAGRRLVGDPVGQVEGDEDAASAAQGPGGLEVGAGGVDQQESRTSITLTAYSSNAACPALSGTGPSTRSARAVAVACASALVAGAGFSGSSAATASSRAGGPG